jgi:hypothetical protein
VLPVLLIYLASFFTPLYHVRYVFTYSTPFYIVVAAGLAWLGRRWRPALWAALAAVVVFSALSIRSYHADADYASDDHRAAVQFLAANWRPGDAILVNAGYAYTALLTYWHGDPIAWRERLVGEGPPSLDAIPAGPVLLQTGTVDGPPSLGWGDPQSDFYSMSAAETQTALAQVLSSRARVWVYRIYDTVTDPGGLIRQLLAEHGTHFEDQVFTGESQLRVQGFLTGRLEAGGSHEALHALADGSLGLLEGSYQPAASVGSALDLNLLWEVGSIPEDDRILFAGLFDQAGRRWAQADVRPVGSLFQVNSWSKGMTIATPLRLLVPPGTPPGRYRLEVGWYRFVDAQPIWLSWTSGDKLLLGEVEITPPPDWWMLPLPETQQSIGVTVGQDMRLVGTNASTQVRSGETLAVELVWQALADNPEPGSVVLLLVDDAGRVAVQSEADPLAGQPSGSAMAAGQAVRDPRQIAIPPDLVPGTYSLLVGRLSATGSWLPVRRGPVRLGQTYPIATVSVMQRTEN